MVVFSRLCEVKKTIDETVIGYCLCALCFEDNGFGSKIANTLKLHKCTPFF